MQVQTAKRPKLVPVDYNAVAQKFNESGPLASKDVDTTKGSGKG